MSIYAKIIKRILDFTLAFIGLLFFSVLMVIIAVIIKIDSPGPAFFSQKRVGKNGVYFTIYKFRTMSRNAPKDIPTDMMENAHKWSTPFGIFLRRTSLDELPQLFNVMKGDMSIVGPRPALWNQDNLINQRTILGINNLRPGLTGWAQINGRDDISEKTKIKFDKEYLHKLSFRFDCYCFFATILKVVKCEGVDE